MKDHLIGVYNGNEVYERSDIPDNHIHCGMALLKDALGMAHVENVPFRRYNVEFDTPVGTDRCVRVDANDTVIMWQRPTRAGKTPMVLGRQPDPTNEMLIVVCQDTDNGGQLTIVTAYTGKPGTKEPWDPNFRSEEERKAAEAFWANHALIPTAEELDQMLADGVITAEEAKAEMERRA